MHMYSEDSLKRLLGYMYPPIHGPLSSLLALHNTLTETALRILLESQPEELVIGSSISETEFSSAFADESRVLKSFPAFESWEDVDESSEMMECSASRLRSLYLIGSRVSLSTLAASSVHISCIERLVLHDIRISWSCTLNPGGLLNQLVSRLRSLEELHLSYCEWLNIDVMEFWHHFLLGEAPLTLKRVFVHGVTVSAEEYRRVAEMQSKLACRGILLIFEDP